MTTINFFQSASTLPHTTVNVAEHFHNMVKQVPLQIAIIEGKQEITYADLQKQVMQTVAYFKNKGIQKGDRVLVFVPMSISLYRIVLALFHIGAVAVFLDEWASLDRLKKACIIAECKGFVGGYKAKAFGFFIKPLRQIPIWLSTKTPDKKASFSEPIQVQRADTALITFTTGSTGIPKAANRTHQMLTAQMEALKEKLQPQIGQVDMSALPIFVFLNLGTGLTSILPDANLRKPDSINPNNIIKQLQKHKVQRLIASPFLVKRIAQHLYEKHPQVPSLQNVYTGGAPVFPQDAQMMLDGFGPATTVEVVYGSTEAEPISSIPAHELVNTKLTNGLPVGRVFRKTQLRILSIRDQAISGEEFHSLSLPSHHIGEIVVAGEHVLKDYINNPEAIKRNKIPVGQQIWHRTGDAGYVDDEGNLFLVGRCAQLIYRDGKYYSPFLFEHLLQQIDGVEMGTILEHDGQMSAVVEAVDKAVVPRIQTTIDIKNLRVILTTSIPRDPRHYSKIDYKLLERMIGRG